MSIRPFLPVPDGSPFIFRLIYGLNPNTSDDADNFILTPYYKVCRYSQKVSDFVFSQPSICHIEPYWPNIYRIPPFAGPMVCLLRNGAFSLVLQRQVLWEVMVIFILPPKTWTGIPTLPINGLLLNQTKSAVVKYVETYRVKLDTALHCTVSLPDVFISGTADLQCAGDGRQGLYGRFGLCQWPAAVGAGMTPTSYQRHRPVKCVRWQTSQRRGATGGQSGADLSQPTQGSSRWLASATGIMRVLDVGQSAAERSMPA